MAILDEFGRPAHVPRKFAESAEIHDGSRPWMPTHLADISELVPSYDRKVLLAVARRLYFNDSLGFYKGAITQKARYSVGRCWAPVSQAVDTAWADYATALLLDQWYPTCDVAGGVRDYPRLLNLTSIILDRDGEAFVLLTESADGWPMVQSVPAHRIGQRRGDQATVAENPAKDNDGSSPYAGLRIIDGIIINGKGRPVAARYLGDDPDGRLDRDISGRNIVHLYDPSWCEQYRGLPLFASSLNNMRDLRQAQMWEMLSMLAHSAHTLVEYNDRGGPDLDDPTLFLADAGSNAPSGAKAALQEFGGGQYRYFRSNSGGKIETISNPRPGDAVQSFWDRLARSSLAGADWPVSLVLEATGQGTAERRDIDQANRAVEDRQAMLAHAHKRILGYAVAKLIKRGTIEENADWWRWSQTLPRRLSIDDGRVRRTRLEEIEKGTVTMAEDLAERGRTEEAHYREFFAGVALRKRVAREIAAETGEDVSDADYRSTSIESVQSSTTLDFETLKAKFDAYGVGVRAGAITPSTADEKAFREVAELPEMSLEVSKAWEKDGGVRRPITLTQPDGSRQAPPNNNPPTDDQ